MAKSTGGRDPLAITFAIIAVLSSGAAFFFGYSLKTQQEESKSIILEILEANNKTLVEYNKVVEQHQTAITKISEEFNQFKGQIEPLSDSISETKLAMSSIQDTIKEINPEVAQFKSEINGIKSSVINAETGISAAVSKIDKQFQDHKNLSEKFAGLVGKFDGLNNTILQFQSSTAQLSQKIGFLEESNVSSLTKLNSLQDKLNNPVKKLMSENSISEEATTKALETSEKVKNDEIGETLKLNTETPAQEVSEKLSLDVEEKTTGSDGEVNQFVESVKSIANKNKSVSDE